MRRARERGSAMVLALLAIALLGMGLFAALMVLGSERREIANQRSQVDAFAVAETGLEEFLVNRAALGFSASPAAAYESTRVSVTGGYADVVLQQLRPVVGSLSAVYVLRSHGVATDPALTGTPLAERTVAQYAFWQGAGMRTLSAFTSLTGIAKTGGGGTLSGVDQCGASGSVGGVAVATPPGYTQSSGASVPAGTPNIRNLGAAATAKDSVNIDWSGIVSGSALTPDITIPPGAFPSFADPSYWPVIKVVGDYNLAGGTGRGVLIVTGSLAMNGNKTWDGVILVGNDFSSSGNGATISGALVSGLNVKLGQSPVSSTLSGTKTFRYHSCNVATALSRFGGLTAYPNAWMDNWAGY
jgi:hypothetical protein